MRRTDWIRKNAKGASRFDAKYTGLSYTYGRAQTWKGWFTPFCIQIQVQKSFASNKTTCSNSIHTQIHPADLMHRNKDLAHLNNIYLLTRPSVNSCALPPTRKQSFVSLHTHTHTHARTHTSGKSHHTPANTATSAKLNIFSS